MYLLIGSRSYETLPEELNHAASWAADNNLGLNPKKTSEMIVSKSGTKAPPPPSTGGTLRVDCLKVLGVFLQSDLKMGTHISEVLSSCSSSLYSLRVQRSHSLPAAALHEVTRLHIGAPYVRVACLVGICECIGEGQTGGF